MTKLKLMKCTIITILLILISITNIVSFNIIKAYSTNTPRADIETMNPVQPKLMLIKNIILALKTIITVVQVQYKHPQLRTFYYLANENINALFIQWPFFVCAFLVRICDVLFDLSDRIYTLGFLLVSQIIEKFSQIIYVFLFSLHCEDYYPYLLKPSLFHLTPQNNTLPIPFTCSCGE